MQRLHTLIAGALLAWSSIAGAADGDVLIVAHSSVPALDAATVNRLYTGRAIEVAGNPVTPVNAASGSSVRQRFLGQYLQQDEDKYRAYWTVRRHVGKGVPPRELKTSAEVIEYVQSTPGAIGYIDAADLKPGMKVVLRP